MLEKRLRPEGAAKSAKELRRLGVILTVTTVLLSFAVLYVVSEAAALIHPWLGYAVSAWYISTTIAVKGLKDAAMLVYRPLLVGNLEDARTYTGYIVGRDTGVHGGKGYGESDG